MGGRMSRIGLPLDAVFYARDHRQTKLVYRFPPPFPLCRLRKADPIKATVTAVTAERKVKEKSPPLRSTAMRAPNKNLLLAVWAFWYQRALPFNHIIHESAALRDGPENTQPETTRCWLAEVNAHYIMAARCSSCNPLIILFADLCQLLLGRRASMLSPMVSEKPVPIQITNRGGDNTAEVI